MVYDFIILGLGKTGFSCVEHILQQGKTCFVVDDRAYPPYLNALEQKYPDIKVFLAPIDESIFLQAKVALVSPGISPFHPWVQLLERHGTTLACDVTLFMQQVKKPVISVTGSNGKSTVVKLLSHLLSVHYRVLLGGNYGIPVLDLLAQDEPDCYVLELSSFQLHYTNNLHSHAAVVLNLCEDHLDWHQNMAEYARAKLKVYQHCQHPQTSPDYMHVYQDCLPGSKSAYSLNNDGQMIMHEQATFIAVKDLPLLGKANTFNIVNALNLAATMQMQPQLLRAQLSSYQGLSHRCQKILIQDGITWYNDSKATNVGACIAAIEAVKSVTPAKLILILSGELKGVSVESLLHILAREVSHVILLGNTMASAIKSFLTLSSYTQVETMQQAVVSARAVACKHDSVLFSPAGASFDLYQNYAARGDDFCQQVKENICSKATATTI